MSEKKPTIYYLKEEDVERFSAEVRALVARIALRAFYFGVAVGAVSVCAGVAIGRYVFRIGV